MKAESDVVANFIVKHLENQMFQKRTAKKIQKNVPKNIRNGNQHSFQSFVLMNTDSYQRSQKLDSNDENKGTIVEANATNRVRSLRIKTECVIEPHKEDKSLRQTRRLDSLRGTTNRLKTALNQLKKIDEIEVDIDEHALRLKKQKLDFYKAQQISQQMEKTLSKEEHFKQVQEKYRNASTQVAFDYDGTFSKKQVPFLKNQKIRQIKSQYGQPQIKKPQKFIGRKSVVKNEMIEARQKESSVEEQEIKKRNKNIKPKTIQQFIENFKDQTLSEGVKFGETSTNTWREKPIRTKKLLSLNQFKETTNAKRFKEYKFQTQSKKLKTQSRFDRRVQTLEVIPNRLTEVKQKLSEGRKRMKTYFGSENTSILSKLTKDNIHERLKTGTIKIGNPQLFEDVISTQ